MSGKYFNLLKKAGKGVGEEQAQKLLHGTFDSIVFLLEIIRKADWKPLYCSIIHSSQTLQTS